MKYYLKNPQIKLKRVVPAGDSGSWMTDNSQDSLLKVKTVYTKASLPEKRSLIYLLMQGKIRQ